MHLIPVKGEVKHLIIWLQFWRASKAFKDTTALHTFDLLCQRRSKLCLLPRLKLWWRFFIDVNKWISLVWIILFSLYIRLMDQSFWNSTISCPQQPTRHFIFELSLGLRMVFKCPPYSVIPRDQLDTYPVTFAKLNKRKEKLHSQTSALKFLFHACKFLICPGTSP